MSGQDLRMGIMVGLETKITRVTDLSTAEIAAWQRLQKKNPALYSPYFRICYTQIINKMCKDVHVLVVLQMGEAIAFLPFQAKIGVRNKKGGHIGFARPVGAPMTDYHGFICAPCTHFDAQAILKQAGFGAYHFSALVDNCGLLNPYACNPVPCTVLDVSEGAENWRAGRDASYRRHLKNTRRKIRNAEKLGERRFEFHCKRQDVYDQLMAWKRAQYAKTGKYDVLSVKWTQTLLDTLWKRGPKEPLRADMHALFIGDTLAAVDLGLSDGETFHSWIVAYNPEFGKVGPGIQLLEALIDEAPTLGYRRIDLGEGIEGYKRHYATHDAVVSSGFIAAQGPSAALSRLYGKMEKYGENRGGRVGRLPGKLRRRYSQIAACDSSIIGRSKAMIEAVLKAG